MPSRADHYVTAEALALKADGELASLIEVMTRQLTGTFSEEELAETDVDLPGEQTLREIIVEGVNEGVAQSFQPILAIIALAQVHATLATGPWAPDAGIGTSMQPSILPGSSR